MFLLLPFLLLTTSANKLVGLELTLPAEGGAIPPPARGVLEDLTVQIAGSDLKIQAALRRMDVRSQLGETERREIVLPTASGAMDLAGLQSALRDLKGLDPDRERVMVAPADGVPARRVVLVMDAVRADTRGALFPEVVLSVARTVPSETPSPSEEPR